MEMEVSDHFNQRHTVLLMESIWGCSPFVEVTGSEVT